MIFQHLFLNMTDVLGECSDTKNSSGTFDASYFLVCFLLQTHFFVVVVVKQSLRFHTSVAQFGKSNYHHIKTPWSTPNALNKSKKNPKNNKLSERVLLKWVLAFSFNKHKFRVLQEISDNNYGESITDTQIAVSKIFWAHQSKFSTCHSLFLPI